MSQLGAKAIEKYEMYAQHHFSPKVMGMKPPAILRLIIAESMFQAYASGRVPMTMQAIRLAKQIAERVYRSVIEQAPVNPDMKEILDQCIIIDTATGKPIPRAYGELSNDVQCYEILRAQWGVDTRHHDKALYKDGAYQLIDMGLRNSDARALAGGLDRLRTANNDFEDQADDFANTAQTEVSFIPDAKLVRADAENFSRDSIEEFKKKYGKYLDKKGGIASIMQAEEQEYEMLPSEIDPDDDKDFFERMEHINTE